MKLTKMTAVLSLLLSFVLFAAPVPQTDLDKVNEYIAQLIAQSGDDEDADVTITSAEREKDGKISSIAATATFEDDIKAEASIDLGETVDVALLVSGNVKEYVDRQEFVMMVQLVANYAQQYVDAINKVGLYKATFNLTMDTEKATADFKLIPASDEAESLNLVEATLEIDRTTGDVTGLFTADMNASAELVAKGQTALTNIFESLLKGEEPKEEDLQKIEEILEEVFKNLEQSGEEA